MIYVDMDETLLSSWHVPHGIKRPAADRLLTTCRSLCETGMLTMGTREYALEMNEIHKLGFTPHQIVAREDHVFEVFGGWYPKRRNMCKDCVLIDNNPIEHDLAQIKIQFLGISPDRYIEITPFYGPPDREEFEKELEEIECRLKSLKS